MIANQTSEVEVKSTMTGQKIAMRVHEAATSHLMNVLSKSLYADPELAVIREYSTNALDAHVEAGTQRPIEVWTPTSLSPFFKVKDYGVGLSVDDVTEIYSAYGASTKRETNDQVGMLGLGCKSAFAYTDQFIVVAIKDGVRIQVSVTREADGSGTMTVADTSSTDEPNGVEIMIPAKNATYNQFEAKCKRFFSFWKDGTVLLNGEKPEPVEGLRLNDDLIVIKNSGNTSYVVMGNVAYPTRLNHGMSYGNNLVAYVPIGSASPASNREALYEDAATKACIAQIQEDFKKAVEGAIQREIDKAENAREALKIMHDWKGILPDQKDLKLSYKGSDLPTMFEPVPNKATLLVVPLHSGRYSKHGYQQRIYSASFDQMLWVENYDRPNFTAGQKKKLVHYYDNDVNQMIQNFLLLEGKIPATIRKYIDPALIVDWSVIHAIKLPRSQRTSSGRIPGSYDMYVDGDLQVGVPADEIDQNNPVYYYRGNYSQAMREAEFVGKREDCTVVCLTENRIEKFKRNFPNAVTVTTRVRHYYDNWAKTITADQRAALAMKDGWYHSEIFQTMDASKVDDPDLKEAIRLSAVDLKPVLEARSLFESVLSVARQREQGWVNPLSKYPLVDSYDFRRNKEHSYIYINAVYQHEQARSATVSAAA